MSTFIKVAPPNSLLIISDRDGGEVPQITRGRSLWATPSCIIVGCLMFMDGATTVTLGGASELNIEAPPAFEAMLETPSGEVVVSTVEWKVLLREKVPASKTRVRIWTNRAREPDEVFVGLT